MAEKKNPFESAKSASSKKSAGSEAAEKESVEELKARIAAKRAARAAEAAVEASDESDVDEELEAEKSTEPEEGEDAEEAAVEENEAAEAEAGPVKAAPKKATRRTAKQVEEEYAAKVAELEAELAKAKGRQGAAEEVELGVTLDTALSVGEHGGAVRIVGDGRTLMNDDWRCTVDGLRVILGRASSQSTQNFVLPRSLMPSLGELLAHISEIAE